jgi:hypothetical protein
MKLLPLFALAIAGAAVVGCGGTRSNDNYDHDVVYRTPAYGERYYYDDDDDDDDVVYVRPAYRAVPVTRGDLIYGGDGYYYYRD